MFALTCAETEPISYIQSTWAVTRGFGPVWTALGGPRDALSPAFRVPGQCKVRITSLATGLTVRQVDGNGLLADSTAAGSWEEFWVTDAGGGNVWLQSNGNGNYVGVYQVGQLTAAFPGRHDFARWRWEDISSVDRTFRLVSVGSGNVVRVTPDSYREVVSDNQNRDGWASFRYNKVYCL
jgi:hypothetical protein